ncbi:unnamed protein product [Lampetra fluviatilis]
MDALEALADEVALEGLDGVTPSALWVRLAARSPPFPGGGAPRRDVALRAFLWAALASHPGVDFYELPVPRPPLLLREAAAEAARDEGCKDEAEAPTGRWESGPDIYPVHMLLDDPAGMQGSCRYYGERTCVTELVRSRDLQPLCTLEEVEKRWGDTLVAVASQELRWRALAGWQCDPDLRVPDFSYCLLERLGRARWEGALQSDLHANVFHIDARKMHYHRGFLDRLGLVTLQSHVTRRPNGSQMHSMLLLLKRFHIDRHSKYSVLMQKLSDKLMMRPTRTDSIARLRTEMSMDGRSFRKLYQFMVTLGHIVITSVVKQTQQGRPCKNTRGNDVMVRSLQLVRAFGEAEAEVEKEETPIQRPVRPQGLVLQRDMLTQALDLVRRHGTGGISHSELCLELNVGKLEGRMLCRTLCRRGLVKDIMEDEGRQRTTKYIAQQFVKTSVLSQQIERERARNHELTTPGGSGPSPVAPAWAVAQPGRTHGRVKRCGAGAAPRRPDTVFPWNWGAAGRWRQPGKSAAGAATSGVATGQDPAALLPRKKGRPKGSKNKKGGLKKNKKAKAAPHKPGATRGPTRLTYRLLKRQNMIIEAVRSHRLIESLFALQKMIVDEERVEGVSSRCCRKSIVRLVNRLADDGQLRLYRTTVVQDGIAKKVELVVHPSVSPHDPLVKSALEQVRFRISGSYSSQRAKASAQAHKAQAEGAAAAASAATPDETSPGGTKKTGERRDSHEEAGESGDSSGGRVSATGQKAARTPGLQRAIDIRMGITPLLDYSPPIVPGLGRSLGFMPKMPRLRILHTFLWYIVHGHKLKQEPPAALPGGGAEAPDGEGSSLAETSGDAVARAIRLQGCASTSAPTSDSRGLVVPRSVYMEVQDWRRFTPPAPIHGEYGEGWALVSDILLCMPLSVFVQLIRISYRVDGLQELLDDPVKKHTLVRFLPVAMRQQLLFKRRYIFLIFECFQRLWFMGLLHFGPLERFQDKDQVFVYLKRCATVVDTTTCEPHYKLAQSSEPFERRTYSLRAIENVDEYWLHMQCVCLNTPLGVVRNQQRSKSGGADGEETEQGSYDDKLLNKKCSMLEYTSGSREVRDDGAIPGDGLGAGGLDSCFFGHLKRNWIWMSYILQKDKPVALRGSEQLQGRAATLTSLAARAGDGASVGAAAAAATTTRGGDDGEWPVARTDDVLLRKVEAANRNKAVAGGKGQKRKRDKRDAEPRKASPKRKKPKKPNESPRKRREEGSPKMYYDETDRSALSRMTKQRVAWTEQEDGLLLLCRVACTILNAKVRRPFVPWQVIRDVLHAEYVNSLDKTSHAVARRSRYILKNSRTDLNYRICLAEATQDSKLVEEIMNQTGDYANPQVCALEFTEFVQRLRAKFRPNPETLQMDIPDSLEELFRKYRVMTVWKESGKKARPEANSLDDIHAMVLENFIQSTLALSDRQVKNNLAYQIFRIYQYYSEQVLLSTFQRYTQRGLVNRRRISKQIGPKKSRALPFAPMSYQLSQGYYRFFTWRYLSSLLTEAHRFMRTLRDAGAEDKPNVVLFRGREPAVTAAPAETPAGAAVTYTMDAPGGACACVLALMAMGRLACEMEIPEQIVVVDSTMVDSAVLKALAHENSDDDDDDEEDNEEDDDESGRHGAGGVGGRQRVDVNPRQSSRVRYLLMKGYYVPGIVGVRNLNPNDNIVVNSCTVRFRLLPSPRPYGLPSRYDALDTAEGVELLPPWFSAVMDGEEPSRSETALYDHDEVDVPAVLDVIRAAGVAGVDMAHLTAAFPHMAQRSEVGGPTRWHGLLQTLEKQGAVLQVGYTSRRVVTPEHAHAWLVRCSRTDDYMESSSGVGAAAAGQNAEDAGAGAELSTIEKAAVTSTTAGAGPGRRSRPGSPDRSPNRPECKEVIVTNGNMNGGAATELETQKAVAINASADDGDDGNKEWRVKGCAVEVVTSTADMAKGCQKRALTTDDNDGDNAVGGDADESARSAGTKRARVDIADVCNGGGARDLEMTAQQETCAGAVRFAARPWRSVQGELNTPVCKGMLEALLLHVMSQPGLPEHRLLRHYAGVLQPQVLRELLMVLEELGCVRRLRLPRRSKVTAFSSPWRRDEVPSPQGEPLNGGDDDDDDGCSLFLEPTVDGILRLGRLLPDEVNWNHCAAMTQS